MSTALLNDSDNTDFLKAMLTSEPLAQNISVIEPCIINNETAIPNISENTLIAFEENITERPFLVEHFLFEKKEVTEKNGEKLLFVRDEEEESDTLIDVSYNPFIAQIMPITSDNQKNEIATFFVNKAIPEIGNRYEVEREKPLYTMLDVSFTPIQEKTQDFLAPSQIFYENQDIINVSFTPEEPNNASPVILPKNRENNQTTTFSEVVSYIKEPFTEDRELENNENLEPTILYKESIDGTIDDTREATPNDYFSSEEIRDTFSSIVKENQEIPFAPSQKNSDAKQSVINENVSFPLKEENEPVISPMISENFVTNDNISSQEIPKDTVSLAAIEPWVANEGRDIKEKKILSSEKGNQPKIQDTSFLLKEISVPEIPAKIEKYDFSINETVDIDVSFELPASSTFENSVEKPIAMLASLNEMQLPHRVSFKEPIFSFEKIDSYDEREIIHQIKNETGQLIDKGHGKVVMQLYPPRLGHVEIELNTHKDGHIHITFATENRETLDILRHERTAIERTFQENQEGVDKEQQSLSFSFRQGQGQGSQERKNFEERMNMYAFSSLSTDPEMDKYVENRLSSEGSGLSRIINIFA